MRRFAVTALALCGCNQIYGLDPTRTRDAPEARSSEVRLSMLYGQATAVASEAPPFVAPVVPAPRIERALLDDPLVAVDYVADATGGVIEYPFDFVGKRWRLAYTPPLGVPHEIQWSPPDGAGHLVVPVIGRLDQTAPPAGTGYTLSMKLPGNVLYSFSANTVLYTAGYWSAAPSTVATLTPSVDFSTATPLGGARGTPLAAPGDVVVAIDYVAQGNCMRVASISGSAVPLPLADGAMTPLELTRFSETEAIEVTYEGETIVQARTRLDMALGPGLSGDVTGSRMFYSRMAHTGMPFTTEVAGVPAPVMIPLAECAFDTTSASTNHAGGGLSFTKAAYVFASNDRVVNGVRLRSSIAAVSTLVNSKHQVTTHVPLAKNIQLRGTELRTDGLPIGDGPGDLSFELESDSRFVAHYYEVTLYKLAGTALEPVRTFLGIDLDSPKVRFDPALMTATDEYVFAVRVYRGRPTASAGDFRTVQNPQAVSTLFTGTFRR